MLGSVGGDDGSRMRSTLLPPAKVFLRLGNCDGRVRKWGGHQLVLAMVNDDDTMRAAYRYGDKTPANHRAEHIITISTLQRSSSVKCSERFEGGKQGVCGDGLVGRSPILIDVIDDIKPRVDALMLRHWPRSRGRLGFPAELGNGVRGV
ncbi:hypothetical protein P691DRAFT_788611 [Macrolepiota fuliginosa MF-IS2]|uniref:Uncharacterized protein n=1 Tax=Macrolepiota fuliginosa MF-IS2 TaxID=1400762 RepID=A0A9P5X1B8_9AGAR|nr:hypothetical protein P691DRAFT_788611 [Macrolepiota fuliginosa MF-IS2]